MQAVRCPVCEGSGQVIPNWDCWDGKTLVSCHGCGGRGWVEIHEKTPKPPFWISTGITAGGGFS